jgi:hypothetical protein
MTQPRHAVTLKKVLLTIDGMDALETRSSEFPGADGQPLPLRTYHPANAGGLAPAVVLVEGYPDPRFAPLLGCSFIDMEWTVTMARLIAASGMVAVTYANRAPADDLDAVLAHMRSHGKALGIDSGRLGLWASSGNGPVALAAAKSATCAVLSNPYLCDLDDATHVADAARTFGFVLPRAGELPHTPLFLIRSGLDEMPGLNASLDRAVGRALAQNLPLTLVNHHDAPHSFDLFHDSEQTRAILRAALSFLRVHLGC